MVQSMKSLIGGRTQSVTSQNRITLMTGQKEEKEIAKPQKVK